MYDVTTWPYRVWTFSVDLLGKRYGYTIEWTRWSLICFNQSINRCSPQRRTWRPTSRHQTVSALLRSGQPRCPEERSSSSSSSSRATGVKAVLRSSWSGRVQCGRASRAPPTPILLIFVAGGRATNNRLPDVSASLICVDPTYWRWPALCLPTEYHHYRSSTPPLFPATSSYL